jgi:hypothetical protein
MTSFGTVQYYGVGQVAVHPCYDGSVDSPYDVALVRYLGALPTTAIIPAMTPAEDKLALGTSVTVIGFGKTLTNSMNSSRFEVARSIDMLTANQFQYSQTDDKGACEGDSGGPAIVQTADGARVAGITSFGDPTCTMVGASVRISPVASFITSFIASAPKTLTCDECSLASVGPGNACINQSTICGTRNSPCDVFLSCASACTTSACVNQCSSTNAQGAAQYNAVVSCQCGGMCQTACANLQSCGGTQADPAPVTPGPGPSCAAFMATGVGGSGGVVGGTGVAGSSGGTGAAGSGSANKCGLTDPRAACAACIDDTCCTEASVCGSDVSCSSCLSNPTAAGCSDSFAFKQLNACLATCSGAPCSGASPTTTGAAGAGGTTGETGGKSGCGCDLGPVSGRASGLGMLLALALVASRARRRR